jgi:hypothetical protein
LVRGAQRIEEGDQLQDLVLAQALTERLHRAGAARVNDLELPRIARGALVFPPVIDQARPDAPGAVREMAGLAPSCVQLLAGADASSRRRIAR